MGLFDRLFGRPSPSHGLTGCWHLVLPPGNAGEPTEVDFRADGRLFYSVRSGNRWQIMKLTYNVDGDLLVTDQPSAPRQERTRFQLESSDDLILEFGGERSHFKRGAKVAPEP
jgi:hypothetical protein